MNTDEHGSRFICTTNPKILCFLQRIFVRSPASARILFFGCGFADPCSSVFICGFILCNLRKRKFFPVGERIFGLAEALGLA